MIRSLVFKFVLFAAFLTFCGTEIAMAQPGGRGGFGGGFQGGGSALGLLTDEKVKDELEIVDGQAKAIDALQGEMRSSMQDMFSDIRGRFRDMDDSERQSAMEEIREKMTATMKEFDDKAYQELLPHQVSRLKQLIAQSQGRRGGGLTGGQMSDSLVEELGITEEQLEAMKAKAEKVRADMTEKMNKLRTQAENEILSVLDASQRAKYKELMGDSFEFSQAGGGFGGGPGGGRGGPGGDRGGRGGPGGDRGPQDGGSNDESRF